MKFGLCDLKFGDETDDATLNSMVDWHVGGYLKTATHYVKATLKRQ